MIKTHQIEKLLGSAILPSKWTMAQYAASKDKHPCQCVREITVKLKLGEVVRVDSLKNKYGKPLGIYQFSHLTGQAS